MFASRVAKREEVGWINRRNLGKLRQAGERYRLIVTFFPDLFHSLEVVWTRLTKDDVRDICRSQLVSVKYAEMNAHPQLNYLTISTK